MKLGTEIFWALRSNSVEKLLGGGLNDQLPERGALGLAAKQAMDNGRLNMLAPFAVERVAKDGDGVRVSASLAGKPFDLVVDRIVVTTGFRPDFSFLSELRIEVDPAVEAPPALAPLIDPNFHSCGDVPPHGIAELAHPEPDFTIVGSKSYGRAPTFLMATGYEQVRSVVAEIAGDHGGGARGAAGAARRPAFAAPTTYGSRRGSSYRRLLRRACSGCVSTPAAWQMPRPRMGKAGCGCGSAAAKAKAVEAAA